MSVKAPVTGSVALTPSPLKSRHTVPVIFPTSAITLKKSALNSLPSKTVAV